MERREFVRGGLALSLCVLTAGCGKGQGTPGMREPTPGFFKRFGYGIAAFQAGGPLWFEVTSPQGHYNQGEKVPIKVIVTNESAQFPFVFDTNGQPLTVREDDPVVDAGLAGPRPVYDLLYVNKADSWVPPYVWVWSANQPLPPPTSIMLAPSETRVLFNVVWQPPPNIRLWGGFRLRFAFIERATGLGVGGPIR